MTRRPEPSDYYTGGPIVGATTTKVGLLLRIDTLSPTLLADMRELAEDTRLIEADIERYWDASTSSFRALAEGGNMT